VAEQRPYARGFASSFALEGKGMTMKTLRNAYNLVTPYQVLVPGYAMEMVWLFLMREQKTSKEFILWISYL
jgi:hypothetical protein